MTDTQARVAERLMSLAASFDSLSWRMQHGEGTLAQLLATSGEPALNLASSTARMDSVMAVMEAGAARSGS